MHSNVNTDITLEYCISILRSTFPLYFDESQGINSNLVLSSAWFKWHCSSVSACQLGCSQWFAISNCHTLIDLCNIRNIFMSYFHMIWGTTIGQLSILVKVLFVCILNPSPWTNCNQLSYHLTTFLLGAEVDCVIYFAWYNIFPLWHLHNYLISYMVAWKIQGNQRLPFHLQFILLYHHTVHYKSWWVQLSNYSHCKCSWWSLIFKCDHAQFDKC